jgi:hypothetical protein
LVEARLLIALGRHQQVVEPVALRVLAEQLHELAEAPHLLGAARVLHPLRRLQVLLDEDVAGERALLVGLDEVLHGLLQLRALLAEGPGDLARGARHVGVPAQLGEDLRVEVGREVVDDELAHAVALLEPANVLTWRLQPARQVSEGAGG